MTDEQFIKALECCVKTEFISDCAKCEMFAFDCKDILIENALDIINRQKAEIERLQKENERWKNGFMGACMLENCKLKDEWKAEAIKEFVERLKNKNVQGFRDENAYVSVDDIDNLVKEMTEVQE